MNLGDLVAALSSMPKDLNVLVSMQTGPDEFVQPHEIAEIDCDVDRPNRYLRLRIVCGTMHPFGHEPNR